MVCNLFLMKEPGLDPRTFSCFCFGDVFTAACLLLCFLALLGLHCLQLSWVLHWYLLAPRRRKLQWVILQPHIGSDGWQYRELQKASPLTAARYDYALVNYDDRLVFVTGGIKMSIWLSSVEYYSIEGDFWMQAPSLHVARRMHSGCALG